MFSMNATVQDKMSMYVLGVQVLEGVGVLHREETRVEGRVVGNMIIFQEGGGEEMTRRRRCT